jgi:hypothetical protein
MLWLFKEAEAFVFKFEAFVKAFKTYFINITRLFEDISREIEAFV